MFDTLSLSPSNREPLMNSASSMESESFAGCIPIALRIVRATSLRTGQKNLTSNPVCEVSLMYENESTPGPSTGANGSGRSRSARFKNHSFANHGTDREPLEPAMRTSKIFKSDVVRSSLNPIWDFDVDFGDVDTSAIHAIRIVVRHVEKLGVVRKDLGEAFIYVQDLLELRSQPPHERAFDLHPTDAMKTKEREEGIGGSRSYGQIVVAYRSGQTSRSMANGAIESAKDSRPRPTSGRTHSATSTSQSFLSKKHNPKTEYQKVKSFHQAQPKPGEFWYAISAKWISNWLLFIAKPHASNQVEPGEICNQELLDDAGNSIRKDVNIKTHFRLINQRTWDFYVERYGGGPTIVVRVPQDCDNATEWIKSIELHKVGDIAE